MIRRRLVLWVCAIAVVAIAASGSLVLLTLETRLVANLDRSLLSGPLAQAQTLFDELDDLGGRTPANRRPRPVRPRDQFDPDSDVAAVVLGPEGRVIAEYPAGRSDDPDPLPDVSGLQGRNSLQTVRSVDGGDIRYRVASVQLPNGGQLIIGESMVTIDETLSDARRILLVTGLAATAAIAALSWALIRRTFQPVESMIATADRIAGGDLSERTDVDDPTTEVGRLGVALDTMLDRIQEAADATSASEDRLRRFVAEASHELRTPLTSVRGYAELYRQGGSDPDTVAVSMERIEAEATRMSRLVDDLLTLARLDREPEEAHAHVDLGLVVGDAVDAIRVVDADRTYDLDVADGRWTVEAVRDRVRQVIDNLLSNAHRYTPPGTAVTTTVGPGPTGCRLVVSDDGAGIPAPERPHVFDRFWRSTRNDENQVDGSGLGLSLVQSFVHTFGGTVSVDGAPSGGARFTIDLPLTPSGPTQPGPTQPDSTRSPDPRSPGPSGPDGKAPR